MSGLSWSRRLETLAKQEAGKVFIFDSLLTVKGSRSRTNFP